MRGRTQRPFGTFHTLEETLSVLLDVCVQNIGKQEFFLLKIAVPRKRERERGSHRRGRDARLCTRLAGSSQAFRVLVTRIFKLVVRAPRRVCKLENLFP